MPAKPVRNWISRPSNFWFLPRTALFHATDDGGAGEGDDGGNDDTQAKEGAGDAGDDGGEGDEQPKKKLVTLERHKSETDKLKAKIKSFEDAETERKKSEMSEVDRVKTEKADLEKRLQRFEAEEKKTDALAKAKKALAKEGKAIDPEKEDFLNRSLRKLAFDEETLDDDVAELVEMASMSKSGSTRTVAGKAGKSDDSDRDPLSYTGKELGEIHKESPERYAAIMAKRKQAIAAKRASDK